MENKEKDIQKEIEKTMRSLDNPPRLKANPWLFARIEEQLSTTGKSNKTWGFSHLLQPAIVCCLLLLNIFTAYTVFNNGSLNENTNIDEMENEYSYLADESLDYYIPE